jgi:hypothetical protein
MIESFVKDMDASTMVSNKKLMATLSREKTYFKKLSTTTMDFIKSRPFMSRTHLTDISRRKMTTDEWRINDNMFKLMGWDPTKDDLSGIKFIQLLDCDNWLQFWLKRFISRNEIVNLWAWPL